MLQPKTYPRLIGRALMLEADPFVAMAEDDNPWVEGLFFTVCLGIVVGIAQVIGGLLTTVSMPPLEQVFGLLPTEIQQAQSLGSLSLDSTRSQMENLLTINWDIYGFRSTAEAMPEAASPIPAFVRQGWFALRNISGLSTGWFRLLALIFTPFMLTTSWLIYGFVTHVVARYFGGSGTLNQTLGSTSLMVAPAVLLLLTGIPFVSVSWLLLIMWGLLIVYRSIEVTHELEWKQSAMVASIPLAMLISLGVLVAGIGTSLFMVGGSI